MCCVQAERVFPASDSEDDEHSNRTPRLSRAPRGQSSRSCPPPRDLPIESQWAAGLGGGMGLDHFHSHHQYHHHHNYMHHQRATSSRCHHLIPARRSFSSSLVADLRAAGPGPTLEGCELLVSMLTVCTVGVVWCYENHVSLKCTSRSLLPSFGQLNLAAFTSI